MDDGELIRSLITVFGGVLGGGLIAWITVMGGRRKNKAEAGESDAQAAALIQAASIALLEPLRQQIKDMSTNLKQVSDALTAAKIKIGELSGQLADAQDQIALLSGQLVHATQLLELHGIPVPWSTH